MEKIIDAQDKTLRDILESKKYSIDFFQREYKWEKKHIEQLIIDLNEGFSENHKDSHKIENVTNYNSYFMGPVILCNKGNSMSIIDGQQRLTSITLLLIYIHNLQKDREDSEPLETLIFSRKHGRNSFNLEVKEREDILNCLYTGQEFNIAETSDASIKNIYERYKDIIEIFPEELKDYRLPLFIDWLKEKLIFVNISANSDDNAYKIFETMNDRGFNLTPTEMLKGYILSKISDDEQVEEINKVWRTQISKLHEISKDEDLEFFRTWLRSKYAETMRQGGYGATNADFELIGTSFHRWVKENQRKLSLNDENSFYYIIKSDFQFYTKIYIFIKKLEYESNSPISYTKFWTIAPSLSLPLFLSSINILDDDETIQKKIKVTILFIDSYVFARSIRGMSITQATIRNTIYALIKEVRNVDIETLIDKFVDFLKKIEIDGFDFESNLTSQNKNQRFNRYILSRLNLYFNQLIQKDTKFETDIYANKKYDLIRAPYYDNSLDNDEYILKYIFSPKHIFKNGVNIEAFISASNSLDFFSRSFAFELLTSDELALIKQRFNIEIPSMLNQVEILQTRRMLISKVCKDIWGLDNLIKLKISK